MKRYTVAKHFWITVTFLINAVVTFLIGVYMFAMKEPWSMVLPWNIAATLSLIVAGILIWMGEGVSRVEVQPIEETAEYIHYARGANYALKQELERKKRFLERLQEEQKNSGKWAFVGMIPGVIGGIIFKTYIPAVQLNMEKIREAFFGLVYPMLFLGVVLIVLAFRLIWYSFINSEISIAAWLSYKFTLDSLGTKIEREQILIGVISERLDRERKEEQKRREKLQQEEKEQMGQVFVTISDQVDLRG